MKQLLIITILSIFFIQNSYGQRTRQVACNNQSSNARWYIMPYIGSGMAWYTYDQNGTVNDNNGHSYEEAESNTLLTYYGGIQALYRFSAVNLGIGGEWQGFNGSVNTGLSNYDINLNYFKFYGRIEAPLYSDSFNDFGVYANVGGLSPMNAVGDKPSIGLFIDLGLYYNLILNKSSSFFFGLGYQQANFNTTLGQAISKHSQNDLRLTFGYRFWF